MFICYCAGTVHRPCIDRAGSVQGLTVQEVCIKCSLCRDRAGTVHGVFFCCCTDRAGTVHRLSGAKRPTSPSNLDFLSYPLCASKFQGLFYLIVQFTSIQIKSVKVSFVTTALMSSWK